jgi:hypothetical protein
LIRAASVALLCAVAVLTLAACRDEPELLLESQVIEAFAAEGITLTVKDREDPPPAVTLEVKGCVGFNVFIYETVDKAERVFRIGYPSSSSDTTRAEGDGVINWRKRNVIVGKEKNSTCAAEDRVSAAVDRLG